jgi:hypothetical protein
LNLSSKIQARKSLIIYNTSNGITTLKKHFNSNHCNIFLKFEEKVSCPLRVVKNNFSKRDQIFLLIPYPILFGKEPFKIDKCTTKVIFERLGSFNCQKPFFFIVCGKYLVEKV